MDYKGYVCSPLLLVTGNRTWPLPPCIRRRTDWILNYARFAAGSSCKDDWWVQNPEIQPCILRAQNFCLYTTSQESTLCTQPGAHLCCSMQPRGPSGLLKGIKTPGTKISDSIYLIFNSICYIIAKGMRSCLSDRCDGFCSQSSPEWNGHRCLLFTHIAKFVQEASEQTSGRLGHKGSNVEQWCFEWGLSYSSRSRLIAREAGDLGCSASSFNMTDSKRSQNKRFRSMTCCRICQVLPTSFSLRARSWWCGSAI